MIFDILWHLTLNFSWLLTFHDICMGACMGCCNIITFHTEDLILPHWTGWLALWIQNTELFPWTVLKAAASRVIVTFCSAWGNVGNGRSGANCSTSRNIPKMKGVPRGTRRCFWEGNILLGALGIGAFRDPMPSIHPSWRYQEDILGISWIYLRRWR